MVEKNELSFEMAIEQLQRTVKGLESGELNLEQSLRFFEDGVRLTRVCQDYLSAAEKRVEILMRQNSETTDEEDGKCDLQPFTLSSAKSESRG